jgi:hypothetical protein
LAKSETGEADVGQEGAEQQGDVFLRHHLFGNLDRFTGLAGIVAIDELQRTALDATGCIDLFKCQFPTLLVRVKERRQA